MHALYQPTHMGSCGPYTRYTGLHLWALSAHTRAIPAYTYWLLRPTHALYQPTHMVSCGLYARFTSLQLWALAARTRGTPANTYGFILAAHTRYASLHLWAHAAYTRATAAYTYGLLRPIHGLHQLTPMGSCAHARANMCYTTNHMGRHWQRTMRHS